MDAGFWLLLVVSGGAVLAAHAALGGTAINTLIGAVAVNVLSGRGLQAAVPVRRRPAVYAALLIIIMLVQSVQTLRTAASISGRTAKLAFRRHYCLLRIPAFYRINQNPYRVSALFFALFRT
jgi:hypothetical protein